MSDGDLALGALGALLVLVALADLFLTIFNYDGFNSLANRLHAGLWRVMRGLSRPLPNRLRHTALSLGSASMLPATYVLWLGLEITGFALIFLPGIAAHGSSAGFALHGASHSLGTAYYLSAGAISSLTFGDVLPVSGLDRALVDVETIVGLTTFTLALGYVVTTFDVLRTLDGLHSTVRRHAEDPGKPSSILARHFRGGQPTELPDLLGSLADRLEDYDQGLRRYPVVYYFHTRRLARSTPRIFHNLGRLLALLRWGLPTDEAMTNDPLLAALLDEYQTTLDRLQRSFVGPPDLEPPTPADRENFDRAWSQQGTALAGDRNDVGAFRELQRAAREAAGLGEPPATPDDAMYEQYRDWLPYAKRNAVVLDRIADALGYDRP
jgi:hypothetical protein